MSREPVAGSLPGQFPRTRKRRKRRVRIRLSPGARLRRRWLRAFRRAPPHVQLVVCVAAVGTLWLTVNWIYQVVRKPTELFFPVSGTLYKVPSETWRQYAAIFRDHSTAVITPEFLAALAQVEGSGNPLVRTSWRWSLTAEPFEVYRPASSAVGMYQITDGTFAEAQRYCIHDHAVVEEGPWYELRSCWFNGLYFRVVPTHAAELTSAYLDRQVTTTLARQQVVAASLEQKQNLAAVIHLCGAGAGQGYVKRGFRLTAGQRCGNHDAATYLARVNALKRTFAQLAGSTDS